MPSRCSDDCAVDVDPDRTVQLGLAGGSIGTSLLNTMVASATASYLASHLNPGTILAGHASAALVQQSLVHGYVVGLSSLSTPHLTRVSAAQPCSRAAFTP